MSRRRLERLKAAGFRVGRRHQPTGCRARHRQRRRGQAAFNAAISRAAPVDAAILASMHDDADNCAAAAAEARHAAGGGDRFDLDLAGSFIGRRPLARCGNRSQCWMPVRSSSVMVTRKGTRTSAAPCVRIACRGRRLDTVAPCVT